MTSKHTSHGSSVGTDRRLPPNGTLGDLQTCFVCNQHFNNSELEAEAFKELGEIQNTFYEVFGISTKRSPEPFRDNPFCVGCERKAKEMQRIVKELETLQQKLEMVRNEMAASIVSTYIYSSKESPNFEMKHLIFEKWYNKVQDFKFGESKQSDTKAVPVAEIPKPKLAAPEKVQTSSASLTKPKRSEREVARLIQQNDERLSHDPKSDNLEEASCAICSKVCRNKDILEVHLKTHGEEKPFLCRFCGKSFFGKAVLKKHLLLKHPDEDWNAELNETVKVSGRSSTVPDKCDKDVTEEASVPGVSKKEVNTLTTKVGLTRKRIQCEMCGKTLPNRKALQKHIRKTHSSLLPKKTKCTKCGKMFLGTCACTTAGGGESLPPLNEDNYSDDNYDEIEHHPPSPDEQSQRYSLLTDKEDVKLFKKLNPAFRNVQFHVFVRVRRVPSSTSTETPGPSTPSTAVEVDEEEKRAPTAPHILKSVAWKAKGAWFTQDKKPTAPSVQSSSIQSNWKSFIQKTKPKPIPVGPRIVDPNKIAGSSTSNPPHNISDPDPSPMVQSGEIEVSEISSDPASTYNTVVKTEESSSLTPLKRPFESISPQVPTPAKRPTDQTYWVDPKNVMQSAPPTADIVSTSPFLAKALTTAKPGVTSTSGTSTTLKRKPGPLSHKKLSDIAHALRLGQKAHRKPGPKPAGPPVSRPSSEQITKLARQLRKSGVGTAKGRFDPVFQLHALGGQSGQGASKPPSALALSRNMEVLASESANKRGRGSPLTVSSDNNSGSSWSAATPSTAGRARPCPASRKPKPPAQTHAPTSADPSMPLIESTMEVETDILTLMQNTNVLVMPSAAVRTPADVSQQMQRSLKRMAGPRSKTKIFRPPGDTIRSGSPVTQTQSLSSAPSNSNPPSFRFVDVSAVLSGTTDTPTISNVSSNSIGGQSSGYNGVTSFTDQIQNTGPVIVKPQADNDSDVELLESDSEFEEDEVPKIRIRNLQSLAEPDEDDVPKIRIRNIQSLAEPEEEADDDCGMGDDDVMEMENTESFIPGASGTSGMPTQSQSQSGSVQVQPTFNYRYEPSGPSAPKLTVTMDALARINDISTTSATAAKDLLDGNGGNGGILGYTEDSIRKFFNSAAMAAPPVSASSASRRSVADQPRPIPTKPRTRTPSPPPETYVYTISPGSMPNPDEDEVIEDIPGPMITSVYSTGKPTPPPAPEPTPPPVITNVYSTFQPIAGPTPTPAPYLPPTLISSNSKTLQPIVSATVKTVPERRRRKSSPSIINEADLDILLGL